MHPFDVGAFFFHRKFRWISYETKRMRKSAFYFISTKNMVLQRSIEGSYAAKTSDTVTSQEKECDHISDDLFYYGISDRKTGIPHGVGLVLLW